MREEIKKDILYFLDRGDVKSLQRAQILLNAEVEREYFKQDLGILGHVFDLSENK